MISDILQYYIFFLSFCLGTILIGMLPALLLFKLNWNHFSRKNLFTFFLFGQIIVCLTYTVLSSSFRSIFIVVIPVFLFLYYKWFHDQGKKEIISKSALKYQILTFLFFSVIAYLWEALFFFNTPNLVEIPFKDISYYARVAEGMRMTGIENVKSPFLIIDGQMSDTGINLYHFYEHWLSALVIDVYAIPPTIAYLLIVIPSLYLMTYCGFYALFYAFMKHNRSLYSIFCTIGLFFAKGVYFNFYEQLKLLEYSSLLLYEPMLWKKTMIYYPMFLLCVYFVLKDKIRAGFYALLILGCFYISSLPAVYIAVFTALVILVIRKTISLKIAFEIALFYALFICIFLAVYLFLKDEIYISPESALNTFLAFDFKFIKTRIFLFIGTLIKISILYSPYLVGLLMIFQRSFFDFKDRGRYILCLLFCLLIVSSMLLWTVLYDFDESWQLFLNTGVPAYTFLLFSLASFSAKKHIVYNNSKAIKYLGIVLISISFCYNFYSSSIKQTFFIQANRKEFSIDYLKEIKNFLDHQDPKKLILGASISDKKDYPKKAAPHMQQRGYYIYGMRRNTFTYQMDNFEEMRKLADFRKHDLVYLPFYNFVKKQEKEHKFNSISKSQIDFFKKHRFKYLILSGNAEVPQLLLESSSMIFTDRKSGERFLIYD